MIHCPKHSLVSVDISCARKTYICSQSQQQSMEVKKRKISKDILNVIRTNMRNNIELTHIADNKANVLLSLNALMLTFLLPLILPYMDIIREQLLYIPLGVLVVTCFVTIYIAAQVLKPGKFYQKSEDVKAGRRVSPFFFGNFYRMGLAEFRVYLKDGVSDEDVFKDHIVEDLHYIGVRLGEKMYQIRIAYSIFIAGFFSAIMLAMLLIIING